MKTILKYFSPCFRAVESDNDWGIDWQVQDSRNNTVALFYTDDYGDEDARAMAEELAKILNDIAKEYELL